MLQLKHLQWIHLYTLGSNIRNFHYLQVSLFYILSLILILIKMVNNLTDEIN